MGPPKRPSSAGGPPKGVDKPKNGGTTELLLLAVGVLVAFTIFGYAQEALTRGDYGGERFKFPTFLILVQSVGNLTVATIGLLVTGEKKWSGGVPMKDWVLVSLAYLGAHFFGLYALAFIPFPLQVVCKSCKAVPVMIGEILIAGKVHSLEKKIQVLLMVAGVVAFTLGSGHKKEGSSDDWSPSPALFTGIGCVVLALGCDGIYGPYQSKIVKQYGANQFHLMFNMNMWELLLAAPISYAKGDLTGALSFIERHEEILPRMAYLGTTMALGSIFIFTMQSRFGALEVTLTTTLRKLISVIFSCFWFGHVLTPVQWAAAFFVFLASKVAELLVGGMRKVGVLGAAPANSAAEGTKKKSQ